ncbi:bestrophin family ion channel [Lutimonas halocynthiae]|uniref:bestrophin family protein n=1 Tax=Lutimonas halocynthiae TaxID=1446477 RepID=UPI0025B5E60E|nr:bestrophin family ion channel [Lutimonas halocynthiae]MDN3642857.1 bestrophin family ion channel [Lutimonas halocynthiae]
MHIKKNYSTFEMAWWTRFDTLIFLLIIMGWVSVYYIFDLGWLKIPWTPIGLIGTAVAFVIGFQNNASYDRIWEARKIWGGIVNTSRTFATFIQDMIDNENCDQPISSEEIKKEIKTLTYRHIAWMTALRYAMRVSKPWETSINHRTNREWGMEPPEKTSFLDDELKCLITDQDIEYLKDKDNKQTAILYLQSHHLKRLKEQGNIWEFSFLELENVIKEMYTLQGKSERIKNFPYPRQFATLNHFFMWIFVLLLPLALVPQFAEIGQKIASNHPIIGDLFIWVSVPIYVIVSWIFHTMERIGRTGDNPFEGTPNDVPISTIARGIEIDLRQNLGETGEQIPDQFPIVRQSQF